MKKALIVMIGVILIVVSLSVLANANEGQATVVREGEDVLQTTDGKIYVGAGIAFNGDWVTIFNVRFPVLPDNTKVGAATFPAAKVTIIYHKGAINPQQPIAQ